MTVSYHGDVTTASPISFLQVLFRWRGSVWKHVYREMALWVVLYFSISIVYFLLPTDIQLAFERFAVQVDERVSRFPLELLLGFFVDLVYGQWKDIFENIGWIDNPALFTSAYIKGKDAATNILRKTIMRYLCLSQVLVLRDISLRVRERFPTLDAVEDAGYLTADEKDRLSKLHEFEQDHWMPTKWACELAMRATDDGRIATGSLTNGLFKEINDFQRKLRRLLEFDVAAE
ncbi:bestrophin-3 [Aphelenchoides avenae]|nr:bestrophin-3 [Aphelenchus avenae]